MSSSLSYNRQYGRQYGETFWPATAAPILGVSTLTGADGAGLSAKSTAVLGDVLVSRGPNAGGSGTVSGTVTLNYATPPAQDLFVCTSVEGAVTVSGQQTSVVTVAFATTVDPGKGFRVHYEIASLT